MEFTVRASAAADGRTSMPQIVVPTQWRHRNIVAIPLHTKDGKLHTVYVHVHAAPVFAKFLAAIDGMPETYDGSWVPRLKRGVKLPAAGSGTDAYGPLLSNHARGTAIDLNAKWLPMGAQPAPEALTRQTLLNDIAKVFRVPMETSGHVWDAGLVWGGEWRDKSHDPMHFELGTFEPSRISS